MKNLISFRSVAKNDNENVVRLTESYFLFYYIFFQLVVL